MALAILELDKVGAGSVGFRIDTGSNRYWQLKVGRSLSRRLGMDWADDIYLTTPLRTNASAGSLIDSHTNVTLPQSGIDPGKAYVQLFTFKSADGRSPSFSDVLAVGDAARLPDPPVDFARARSMTMPMDRLHTLPRVVPCRTGHEALARQTSLDELLGGLAKAAVPLVVDLLKGGSSGAAPANGSPAAGAAGGLQATPGGGDLMRLLGSLVAQIVGGAGGVSQSQSILRRHDGPNRFSGAQSADLSQTFFAPALLAFLGPLMDGIVKVLPGVVGPIAENAPGLVREINQGLPMLINSINQRQMQNKLADNKLATDTLAQVNQRMLVEDFLRSQQAAPAAGATPDAALLAQLLQALQQAAPPRAAAPAAGVGLPAATAAAQSLTQDTPGGPAPSRRAVLTFGDGPTLTWNGGDRALYTREHGVQLRLRLVIAPPVPTSNLPKAILKLVFQDSGDKSPLLEKTFKLKDVAANSDLSLAIGTDELANVPSQRPITAYAELRWLTGVPGSESVAIGKTGMIFVDKCFVKQQGSAVGPEREPRDMNRFRSFWNKLWESPVLDEAGSRRERPAQVLWELDVNAKYSVLLSAEHDANGVMETRLLEERADPQDISQRTQGRLKGGVELSIAALAQLLPLWDDAAPLAPEQLTALAVKPVVLANASELIYRLKLHGKAGQRGIVWVVPVFRLVEFTLGRVRDTDDSGRVTGAVDETVRLPLPVAARIIGVKSEH